MNHGSYEEDYKKIIIILIFIVIGLLTFIFFTTRDNNNNKMSTPNKSTICEDVTSIDYNWDNDVLCTRPDGSQFYTDYARGYQADPSFERD